MQVHLSSLVLLAAVLLAPLAVAQAGPAATTSTLLQLADVDGDGLQDAAVLDERGRLSLHLSLGGGRFEDITLASGLGLLEGASCVLLEDLDGDGDVDLFAGSAEQRVWLNAGNALFEPARSGIEHEAFDLAAQALDLDADGRTDLLLRTELGDRLLRNVGGGRFERVELPLAASSSVAGAAAPIVDDATLREDAAGLSVTARRLRRWIAARNAATAGGSNSALAAVPTMSGATNIGNLPLASLPSMICAGTIVDQGTGQCIEANSAPTLGELYPLSTHFNVAANGNVGMGTTAPEARLHLHHSSAGAVTPHSWSSAVIERGFQNFISLLTPNLYEMGIYFGRPASATDAFLKFDPANQANFDFLSLGFSSTNLFGITRGGHVGIGTYAPTYPLEVWNNPGNVLVARLVGRVLIDGPQAQLRVEQGSAGSVTPSSNASAYFERDTDNYLQLLTPDANESGVLFGNPTDGGAAGGIIYNSTVANGLAFRVAGNSTKMVIDSGGKVGIGTSAPSFLLHVDGSAGKPGGGSWSVASDARLKTNVAELDGALAKLLELRGVTYEYKDPSAIHELGGEQIGFLAQEVERVFPEWVETGADGYKRLSIRGFEALTVEALRELRGEANARAERQAQEMSALASQVAQSQARVAALEAALSRMLEDRDLAHTGGR